MSTTSRPRRRPTVAGLAATVLATSLLVSCTSDPAETVSGTATRASCAPSSVPQPVTAKTVAATDTDGVTLRLVTHDSFAVSDGLFDRFTDQTGITVQVVPSGDAGQMVSQSILTAGNPVGDVMFGIDNTLLCRGERAGLFVPYEATGVGDVPADLRLAEEHLATPIDVGDVCLNYADAAYPGGKGAPGSLEDLTEPAFENTFVTENPETSSPGLAFLLATVAQFGEDGWEQYWKDLRANGVKVTSGWSEAYEDEFGSGTGERSIVTSYASSPVADVLYADPPRSTSVVGVVPDACFRQVEFAGILRGTDHPEAAAKLVDFLLSTTFQDDIPLNMFVAPVNPKATIPAAYATHATVVDDPITMTPAEIEAGRDRWTERWTQIVLR